MERWLSNAEAKFFMRWGTSAKKYTVSSCIIDEDDRTVHWPIPNSRHMAWFPEPISDVAATIFKPIADAFNLMSVTSSFRLKPFMDLPVK